FHKLFHPECQNEKCHMNTHWTFARERISENQSYEYQFDDKILGRYLLVQFRPIYKQISENSRMDHMFLVATFSDIIMINQDITEKKRLDSIAESVDVMEKLNYIFSAVRHEIGNPVNAIKITASVLKKNIGKFSDEKIQEYTNRVLSEITRIEYLLQSFKSFVMFENIEMINFPISQFLSNLVSLFNETFKEKDIKIELDLNSENDTVHADPRSLHQVLLNIINNAIDALKDETDKWIKISTNKSGGKIQITVTDNGKGFTEEEAKNLFQPFFTTKTHGTGLGLVIVKKILTHMQGEIKIDSHINIGTTVTISLLEGKDENL
ncbi:MAG TPA: HAMP domain-containing sensor histidine kinase, partial [Candidatus Deferrimicrobium sp.]|nr:HAMP domain-containing sensor histidine kinase [Candidatus Deferrimicrobium sp.]